jgi:hypothetical protein
MAEKSAVFTLRVDTGNSVNDINSFDKSLQGLNKDIDKTQSNLNDSTATDQFAQNLQELNAKVEAGGLTMRQLSKVVREYQSIALATGETSPIGIEALRNAADLTDRMGDVRAQTAALSSDFVGLDTAVQGIETGAAVFQGVQSAIALTGVENEKLMETMVKLQAVQGVVNSVNTIAKNLNSESVLGLQLKIAWEKIYAFTVGTTTGALKLLRIAMISTGIGALIVGLALLIANFDKVVKFVQMAYDKFNKLGTGVKVVLSIMFPFIGVIYGVIKALEYFGIIDDETERKMKSNAKKRSEYTRKEADEHINNLKRQQKQISDRYDHEINKAKAAGKDTTALEQAKRMELLKTGRAILAEQKKKQDAYKAELAMLVKLGDADSKRSKDLKKLIGENAKAMGDQFKLNKDNSNAIEVANIEAQNRANERAADRKKKRDDEKAEIKKFVDEVAGLTNTAKDKELSDVKTKYEERIRLAKTYDEMQALITAQTNEETAINLKYAQEKELKDVQSKYAERLLVARKYYKEDSTEVKALLKGQATEEEQIKTKYANDALAKQQEASAKSLKETEETEKKRLELASQYRDLIEDEYQAEISAVAKTQEAKSKLIGENLAAGNITAEEAYEQMLKLEKEYDEKIVEVNKKKNKDIQDAEKKTNEDRVKEAQKLIENAQKVLNELNRVNDIAKMFEENKIAQNKKRAEEQTLILDEQLKKQLNNENLTEAQRTQIQESFAKKKYQVQLKQFQDDDKIKQSQFKRDKALRIAQIAIDTASAIAKGIATFGPPPSPAGIASIAFASAIGIAQAAAVAKQQYQGGSAPSAPNVSAGSGMGASAFQINTGNQQTTSTTTGPGSQTTTPSVPVILVESDVTGIQNKVKAQENKSLFG